MLPARSAGLNCTPAGKIPAVARPIDADVLRARLHAEGVEQAVVVVRIAVELVHRDVELVGAFDEVEAVDRERHLGVSVERVGFISSMSVFVP